jgi:rhomboid family GlyGly-CTERM serine protease
VQQQRLSVQQYWIMHLILLTVMIGLLQWVPEYFQYDRSLVLTQPWRLITAHLVHLSPLHLMFNIVALWGLFLLFEPPRFSWFYSAGLIAGISIGLYIHLALPEYAYYRGLSGVLHGWYLGCAWWAMHSDHRMTRLFGSLIIVMLLVKMCAEAYGLNVSTRQILQIDVLWQAHLIGALTVMGFTFLWQGGAQIVKKGV